MKSRFPLSCLSLAICHAISPIVQAGNISVDNDQCTLVEAITSANSDTLADGCSVQGTLGERDTIGLTANSTLTYVSGFVGSATTALPFITSNITIQGNNSIIERSSTTANNFRIVAVTGTGNLILNDATLRGANLTANGAGSALYVGANAGASLNRVTLTGNADSNTGGSAVVLNTGGILLISRSTVSNNTGRALRNNAGAYSVVGDSTITGNTDEYGGAFLNLGDLRVTRSEVRGNTATVRGGALYTSSGSETEIQESTFSMNHSEGFGGAIVNSDYLLITQSQLRDNTALDRGGAVYSFANSETEVRESDLTGNSAADFGGAIFSSGAVTFYSSELSNNYAQEGGAIFAATAAEFTLSDTSVNNNSAGQNGGGFHIRSSANVELYSGSMISENTALVGIARGGGVFLRDSASLGVRDSQLNANQAGDGGAIASEGSSSIMIQRSSLNANSAEDDGGAIFSIGSSRVDLRDSRISNSRAVAEGGALFVAAASVQEVYNSTLHGNVAEISGGAVGTLANGRLILRSSTVSANSALVGGGIAITSIENQIINSTLSGNSAEQIGGLAVTSSGGFVGRANVYHSTITGNVSRDFRGGGLYAGSGSNVNLANSIISGNTAPTSSEVYSGGGLNSEGGNLFGAKNINTQQALGLFLPDELDINASSDGDTPTSLGNIISPLGNYGGPTRVHGLTANSPAINNGYDEYCERYDQRGEPRSTVESPDCDIGAVEGVVASESCFVVKASNGKVLTFCL